MGVVFGGVLERVMKVCSNMWLWVGDGTRVRFWYDQWSGHFPL